jgi:DHA2 family multidrug resistance protein
MAPQEIRNSDSPQPQVNKWAVAASVMLPVLIEIMDMTVVNVSLRHIQGSLSAGLEEVTWVLTSYLVSNAVVIPATGWVASLFGRKRYLIFSIILFSFSSFMCGAAPSLDTLLLFRVVQGVGGGALQPLSLAILLEAFPPSERGMAMAIFGMGVIFGPILGPILGGWITDNLTWRWIFYINIPIGVIAIILALMFIFDPPYIRRKAVKIDYLGLALLVLGIGSLQVMLDRGEMKDWFSSNQILVLAFTALICIVGLVVWELMTEDPVIDLRAFADRSFSVGNIVMFLGFFCFFGSIVILPIFLQDLMGYTAFLAGVVLGPSGMATLLTMPIIGKLIQRVQARYLLGIGLLINSFALYLMSGFNLQVGFNYVLWTRVIQGFGLAFFFVPCGTVTLSTIPRERMGNATSLFNIIRNIGGSIGVAFATTLLSQRFQFHHSRLAENMSLLNERMLWAYYKISVALGIKGFDEFSANKGALGLLYSQLNLHARMLAFNDIFWLLAVILLLLTATLILVRPKDSPTVVPPH